MPPPRRPLAFGTGRFVPVFAVWPGAAQKGQSRMSRETTASHSSCAGEQPATSPYVQDVDLTLYNGDCLDVLRGLPELSIHAVVTSPPYANARPDYDSFSNYTDLFRGFERVVSGPALINVGRVFKKRHEQLWWLDIVRKAEFQDWFLLDTLVWVKPNGNPIHGNVFADRHEYVLIFGREGCVLNTDAIRMPYAESSGPRLKRGWTNHIGVKNGERGRTGTRPSEPHPLGGRAPSYITAGVGVEKGNEHPAPMPLILAEHLVALASFPGQTVLDPFAGSGTTAIATRKLERKSVLIEANADYCAMAAARLGQQSLLAEPAA